MSKRSLEVAPSLICCDLCRLEESVNRLQSIGVDRLHVDLLDGHFSPSMPIGLDVVKQLRKRTSLPFDVHLMVEDNEWFVSQCIAIGAERICFHWESSRHPEHLLKMIRDAHIEAGIALAPETRPEVLEYLTEELDFILIMLINPGYAGHPQEGAFPGAMRKVADCRQWLAAHGKNIPILLDGRISLPIIPELTAAGADSLVAGSKCLFIPGTNPEEQLAAIREAQRKGRNYGK